MSQTTVNPYSTIGTDFSSGLAAIIAAYATGMTLADITTEVVALITTGTGPFYPSPTPQVSIEISAISSNSINSYVNGLVPTGRCAFTAGQLKFINMLIGPVITANMPVLSLNNYILDVEDNITKSDLTLEEQIPLLIATKIGETAYTYWTTDVAAASPAWGSYYQSNVAENYANIPFWVSAAMEGALAGYAANFQGQIEPSTNNITTRMVAALIGALSREMKVKTENPILNYTVTPNKYKPLNRFCASSRFHNTKYMNTTRLYKEISIKGSLPKMKK